MQFPVVFKNVRRARLRKFPYALFFRIMPDALFVIACFHGSRGPNQWQRGSVALIPSSHVRVCFDAFKK